MSHKKNKMILDYATDMKFETYEVKTDCLKLEDIKKIVLSKKKAFLEIYEEE